MANEKNLKPARSKKEARERGQKGGIKSGQVRKEKKLLKELLEEALSTKTETGNHYIDITNALILKAEMGDTKAYEIISNMLGQKPSDKLEFGQEKPFEVNINVKRQEK